MPLIFKHIRAAIVGTALVLAVGAGATAQELSPSHIAAAEKVGRVAPAVGDFDGMLPYMSSQVQNRLILRRPDLFREIAIVVEEQALELSVRRADLENDIARIWARRFSEEELIRIADFFGSEVGAKYKEVVPLIGQDMLRSSQSWAGRISEELYERSIEEMTKQGHEM